MKPTDVPDQDALNKFLQRNAERLNAEVIFLAFVTEKGQAHAQTWTPDRPIDKAKLALMLRAIRGLSAKLEEALGPEPVVEVVGKADAEIIQFPEVRR